MSAKLRIGTGVDAHRFGETGPCFLAGLEWPEAKKLLGHSDGDAAAHALCDAVLSAAHLGDLGSIFGIDKSEWANASGTSMVAHVRKLVAEHGFTINNVSLQIVGNEPKISARRLEAEEILSAALGAPVSVSATTSDEMGFTGRGEGVYVIANALVQAP